MSKLRNSQPYQTISGAVPKMAAVLTAHRAEVRRINASLAPAEMKQEAIKRATVQAQKQLDQMKPLIEGSEAIVLADAQQQLFRSGGPQGSTTEALMARLEVSDAWRRIDRRLDAAKDSAHQVVRDLATKAAKSGDLTTLRALRAEVPDYFAAKGEEATGEALVRDIEKAWSATFTSDQVATHEAMQAFEKGAKRVKVALGQAQFLVDRPDEDAVLPLFANEVTTIPGVSPPTLDERVNVFRNLDPGATADGAAQAAGSQAVPGE